MNRSVIIRSSIIICLILVLACIFTSCGENEKTKKENGNLYSEKLMKTLLKPNQEAIALLSLKYDLQPSMVESLLDSYLSETDLGYKILKESFRSSSADALQPSTMASFDFEKESYSKVLAKASQPVGITVKTAALLILDYKMFTARDRDDK
jgi:hypothetical protein